VKKSSVLEGTGGSRNGREGVQEDPRSGQPKMQKGQMQMWTEYGPWCAQV